MKRHRHLLERVISLENLFAAAKAAMKGKRSTPAGARFFAEQEKEIIALGHELRTGTYRHGAYHYFQIHEPKERTVAAAPFRDRVVHHAIVRVLETIFDRRFIEDSFACRKGKGTHAALRRCAEFTGRHRYALKCDVAKYFPSIDQGTLLEMMERVIADEGMMALIRNNPVNENNNVGFRLASPWISRIGPIRRRGTKRRRQRQAQGLPASPARPRRRAGEKHGAGHGE